MSNVTSAPKFDSIPARLEAGDHLDQSTFHRLYEQTSGNFRAELLQGIVIVPSPLSPPHAQLHSRVMTWLGCYVGRTPGTDFWDNATILFDHENELQPDAALIVLPECGGRMRFNADGYPVGSPDLIVEVASSSAAYDLHEKLETYQQCEVREYLVVLARERQVRRYSFERGALRLLDPDQDGILRSTAFPGLWLDPEALVRLDLETVLNVLQQGTSTDQHAEFVRSLKAP